MADNDENEVVQEEKAQLFPMTTAAEWTAAASDSAKVTAVAFVSRHCQYTDAAKATMKELSTNPDYSAIAFFTCDADESPEVARSASSLRPINALPAFFFVFNGEVLEHFAGSNMEKLRVCTKAAELKKKDVLVRLEKEREESVRKAAEEEAARAAAEASGPAAAAAQ